jgi:hypothetical protein
VGRFTDYLVGGIIGGIIGLVLTTLFQDYLNRERDEIWMSIFPKPITFEASRVSGCSGGELGRLVAQAEKQGLQTDSQIGDSFLCAVWGNKTNPRRMLEDIATRFDKCFAIDNSLRTPKMEIKSRDTSVCTTNLDVNSANQWVSSTTRQIFICDSAAQTTAKLEACSKSTLQLLGFQK